MFCVNNRGKPNLANLQEQGEDAGEAVEAVIGDLAIGVKARQGKVAELVPD